jgi:hypothetical protein
MIDMKNVINPMMIASIALQGLADLNISLPYISWMQLLLKSKTRYYSRGSIIADSREESNGLFVITAGQVCLPC